MPSAYYYVKSVFFVPMSFGTTLDDEKIFQTANGRSQGDCFVYWEKKDYNATL